MPPNGGGYAALMLPLNFSSSPIRCSTREGEWLGVSALHGRAAHCKVCAQVGAYTHHDWQMDAHGWQSCNRQKGARSLHAAWCLSTPSLAYVLTVLQCCRLSASECHPSYTKSAPPLLSYTLFPNCNCFSFSSSFLSYQTGGGVSEEGEVVTEQDVVELLQMEAADHWCHHHPGHCHLPHCLLLGGPGLHAAGRTGWFWRKIWHQSPQIIKPSGLCLYKLLRNKELSPSSTRYGRCPCLYFCHVCTTNLFWDHEGWW